MTSREKFEAWMTAEQWFHGSDFEWDERRNCYAQFGIHLAYKAFLAAEGAAEQKLTDMAVQLANAESKCRELAAENAGLNKFIKSDCWIWDDKSEEYFDAADCMPETPATDAFLAEVRASARNEGINYAASRLAAAFNHGFVDKPLAEVCDVVRMILDTKEELANSTQPAADGISGEYAERFLAEFAAQLRKGATL
ncbi:hypothetical protein [Citrobacter sp. wls710]|uniref:hypothetical protein n=1 Tax=Citrobacter sp. wls710 TaxID=2576426 RepID=UPI0020785A98|nr:hypothetical protein [Citrobacter sp. wls710]